MERLPKLSCFETQKELNIICCIELRDIEGLKNFWSCQSIYIDLYPSLKILPNLSNFKNLEKLTIRYSLGVLEIPGIEDLRPLTHLDITGCESIETLLDLSACKKLQFLLAQDSDKLA